MKETFEFRVPTENAVKFLPAGVGEDLGGSVRKVTVAGTDPLLPLIAKLEQEFRARDGYFFHGWQIRRSYSAKEIDSAELFHLKAKRYFEPSGEECGTVYDDARACGECVARAPQVTPLHLDGRKIPKTAGLCMTIGREIVVSRRFVDVVREHGLRGCEFEPVRLSNQKGAPSAEHFQLRIPGPTVALHPTTRAGEEPFDQSAYGRCSKGDTIGLNLLSAVSVDGAGLPDADFLLARQSIGHRLGLLRPWHPLLITPRAFRVLSGLKWKALGFEVAYIV